MPTTVQQSSVSVLTVDGETFVNGEKIENLDASQGVIVTSHNGHTTINGHEVSGMGASDAIYASDSYDASDDIDRFDAAGFIHSFEHHLAHDFLFSFFSPFD